MNELVDCFHTGLPSTRSGWRLVEWRNLTGGIVALHRAIRPA
jgi:hypothetical protein